jgi:hypothetical protein
MHAALRCADASHHSMYRNDSFGTRDPSRKLEVAQEQGYSESCQLVVGGGGSSSQVTGPGVTCTGRQRVITRAGDRSSCGTVWVEIVNRNPAYFCLGNSLEQAEASWQQAWLLVLAWGPGP